MTWLTGVSIPASRPISLENKETRAKSDGIVMSDSLYNELSLQLPSLVAVNMHSTSLTPSLSIRGLERASGSQLDASLSV